MTTTTNIVERRGTPRLSLLNVAKAVGLLAASFYVVICAVAWITEGDPGLLVVVVALMGGSALIALRRPIAGGVMLVLAGTVVGLFFGYVGLMLTTAENALRDMLLLIGQIAGPALIAGIFLIVAGSRARTHERGAS